MEEQLITAVSYHSVLYDMGCVFYRDRISKEEAWVKVAQDVGFSVDVCRKHWKGLRDVYMREKRME